MKSTTAGGAVFTPVTLDEIKKVVFRAYHALDPKMDNFRGEVCIDLALNDDRTVLIRVMTSVHGSSAHGADVGSDAMRVGIWGSKGRFLEKTQMVKRTPNWKDTLQERIDDAHERYDDETAKWEKMADPSWAPGQGRKPEPSHPSTPPPPPAQEPESPPVTPVPHSYGGGRPASDKQVQLLLKLLRFKPESQLKNTYGLRTDMPLEDVLRALPMAEASSIITSLIGNRGTYNRRYAEEPTGSDAAFPDALVGYIFEGDE
jgi:hypothetical protein